jgi:hypothetical protein
MIPEFPIWIDIAFLLCVLYSLLFFYLSNGKPWLLALLILAWSLIHSGLAYSGFYLNMASSPPRFALVLGPSIFAIILGLRPASREWIRKNRDIRYSTLLHVVRIPVELVLFKLYTFQYIPQLMTFEGRNFDILSGISALIIALLLGSKGLNRNLILVWNYIGLVLILFILMNGLLSAELPFQQFAFDQPNRAVSFFPYLLLPATIVPLVIWTHISDIIFLRKSKKRVH